MPVPGRSGGGGGGGDKTDKQKAATASKQVASAVKRLDVAKATQNQTLTSYGQGAQSYQTQQKASKANPFERIGSSVLDILNRPSQASLHAIENRYDGPEGILRGIGTGLAGRDPINFRQATEAPIILGKQGWRDATPERKAEAEQFATKFADGRGAGIVDLAGTAITDPLTYTGFGGLFRAGGAARGGLKAVENVAGKETAQTVARQGAKSLGETESKALRQKLVDYAAQSPTARIAANPDKYVNSLLGETGKNALTRGRGALEEAQGLKIAGKTVLPRVALEGAAEGVGLGKVARAVGENAATRAVARTFVPRAEQIADVGRGAADKLYLAKAGRFGQAARLKEDIKNTFERATGAAIDNGVDVKAFQRDVVGPALESGKAEEVVQQLRSAGREPEAALIEATDHLRRAATDTRLQSGVIKGSQLMNDSTRVAHIPTKEFKNWLQKNAPAAENLFGFKAQSGGILSNSEAQFRRIPGTIAEKNALIAEKTGGAVKQAFEDNASVATIKDATKAIDDSAKASLLDDITKITAADGRPLAIKSANHADDLKALRKAEKETLTALDKEIKTVKAQVGRESVRAAGRAGQLKATSAASQALGRKIDKLEARLAKIRGQATAAGVERRAATEAGKAALVSTKLATAREIRNEFMNILSDPNIRPEEKALLRKDYADALRASRSEVAHVASQNAPEIKRAASKATQQRIGAAKASTKLQQRIVSITESQLAEAKRELAQSGKRSSSLSKPLASTQAHLDALLTERMRLRNSAKAQRTAIKMAAQAEAESIPKGYVKFQAGAKGTYYAPRSIHDYMRSLESKINNPSDMRNLYKASMTATQVMKNYTLNALPFAVGRNVRDIFGNSISMWQKGFKNPQAWVEAAKVQKAIDKGLKAGKSYEEAVAGLSGEMRKFQELADSRGVINSGQLRSDVEHAGLPNSYGKKIGPVRIPAKGSFDPRNAESIGTRTGAKLNTALDDISRRAMFIDQMWQHGDADTAALTTKEALFDYADLTENEKAARAFIWFYTFTARNLALQASVLAHAPEKLVGVERFKNDVVADDSAVDQQNLPQYALNSGQVPLGKFGKTPLLGTIQTPFEAGAQAVQPFVDLASAAGPEKYTTQAGLRGGASGVENQFGGLIPGIVRQGAEEASGADSFTGAPLDPGKKASALRIAESQIPRGSQWRTTGEDLSSKDSAVQKARILSLLGVSNTAVTDQRQTGELYRRKRALDTAAKRQDLPTLTQQKKGKKGGAAKRTVGKK